MLQYGVVLSPQKKECVVAQEEKFQKTPFYSTKKVIQIRIVKP